jgi:putative SOS response-associated peptidase YedK
MCGRYGLTQSPNKVVRRLGGTWPLSFTFASRYNIAPTQPVLAMLNDSAHSVAELRWGLIPPDAESPSAVRLSTFNARVERIATAPLYQKPFRERRCAIFADGFYEWRRNTDGSKTPMWIHRRDREPFVFAGLWDVWLYRKTGDEVKSCTIITQPANELLAPIHDRMPVVLDAEAIREWLNPDEHDPKRLLPLLAPTCANDWTMHPVSSRVNAVRNDGAYLIEAIELQTQQALNLTGF